MEIHPPEKPIHTVKDSLLQLTTITAGILIGAMARIIVSALSVAGYLIASQTGLSYATTLDPTSAGQQWWFGWLASGQETARVFDLSTGRLAPYLHGSDVRLCPSPVWDSPQFKCKGSAVIFSYGANSFLFAGENQQPVVRGMPGKIDQEIDLVLAD